MATKVIIRGIGKAGRLFLKHSLDIDDVDVVAIADDAACGDINNLAYLLNYDTVHGVSNHQISESGSYRIIHLFTRKKSHPVSIVIDLTFFVHIFIISLTWKKSAIIKSKNSLITPIIPHLGEGCKPIPQDIFETLFVFLSYVFSCCEQQESVCQQVIKVHCVCHLTSFAILNIDVGKVGNAFFGISFCIGYV